MKQIYFFKTTLVVIFVLACRLSSYALTAGDIAIIGINTDATKTLTFVALADIPASTTISFTDNAWDATTPAWRSGEGTIQWTNTSTTNAGTVITLTLDTTYSATVGSVTTSASFNLSATGDQVLAYEGTTAPTTNDDSKWLFAFSNENFVFANNSNSSDYPTALSNASVAMTTSTTEVDNAYFTTSTMSATKEEILQAMIDPNNYTKSNTLLTVPTYSFTITALSSILSNENDGAIKVIGQEGQIAIIATKTEFIQVYNFLGVLIKTTTSTMGESIISVPSKQLYIVKIGNRTTKVLVK